MTESLKNRIQEDMKAAMRAQEKGRLGTIRLLLAAIKQREIDEQITLDDAGVMKVIEKMIKQRRDSITQYEAGNRPDLAEKEKQEIDVLQAYLPEALSDAEIDIAVKQAIEETGATSMKDMGQLMGVLKGKLQGRVDMSMVSKKVKEHLS
ncbi:CBU_1594 family Dot/Icm type IV secretion system effector [Coxiella burnetii]|uniref:GatB/YqeY domain protein n=1 Tax=Coxiella burnetii (strain RSA 493 / Nine Mile phase I) TaxID=227377 RepID=Q83BB8_COXBU|nr:CBU_1594 family Dot/Icm type IV secretion system effector [Coxiella burnetii]NP_820577.1 GatB/YqeY domain-containing protein [Coxiella burnetii RSA 493]AAO91091.1 GatB/YqeY domain protein [Coxiella burnetii RSA 493]ABX78549.1 GatB/YqeY domain protein [Coxiella burnetii RSA 331]ACJ20947.1 GatB/Yqey domain protein [Coxiella burnetii CbuK_Q154]AIT64026.1 Yqey-like family protein [Coxiella burnetii str. Namibia]AML48506.1 glutamyl-tRNA amidotransferase [Coxiella burnetii]